ncbi:protein MRP-126-like [Gouania willdenowi]|uniref:protein MRP-126-like n=1 Tax=Gouania willdenowi TaxID=441366 RepID=UPI0010563809|nr:protein MRP-126-like [Gouania willdenowi]
MSELMTALETVMKVYDEYAAKDEQTGTLTKTEAKQLMQEQLSERFEGTEDEGKVDQIFEEFDCDSNGEINFGEFGWLVCSILHAIHKKCPA